MAGGADNKDREMAAHMKRKGIQRPGSTLRLPAVEARERAAIPAGSKYNDQYAKIKPAPLKDVIGKLPF